MRTTRVVQVAKSSKKKTDKTVAEDASLDEVVLDAEEAVEVEPEPEEDITEQEVNDRVDESVEVAPEEEPVTEDIADTPEPVASEVTAAPTEQKRGGFVPLLIGGLVAGGIGYGAETYLDMQQADATDFTPQIEAQSETIAALQAQLDALPATPDTGPLEARIAEAESALTARIDALETGLQEQLTQIETRVADVEKRPSGDGTLSETAIAAYERELEALRADVTGLAERAEADLAAARAAAEAMEQDALAAARAAEARAAVNRVAVAIETGQPFDGVLADLESSVGSIPPALSSVAADGVASQDALDDAFPAAARAALASARAEGQADENGGLGAFLRRQFEVRSTTPREGTDPDAILSRAQAAVEEGRLADALSEIEALPEVARAELTDWTADAQARVDALEAIADLTETLKEN